MAEELDDIVPPQHLLPKSTGIQFDTISDLEMVNECANCGEDGKVTGGLLRCSRCKNEYFCSFQCQKEYWPFHKTNCKTNEFADVISQTDPALSKWMRRHGKQAVLKDAEIDRLERSSSAYSGVISRAELLAKMSGRINPMAAIAPCYSESEKSAMMIQDQKDSSIGFKTDQIKHWEEIKVIEGLGVSGPRFKWRQTLTTIEVFVMLAPGLDVKRNVYVDIQLQSMNLILGPDTSAISGRLYKPIEKKSISWFVIDGVLSITLVKFWRKGKSYEPGTCCDATWWPRLLADSDASECISQEHPPSFYYSLPLYEERGKSAPLAITN